MTQVYLASVSQVEDLSEPSMAALILEADIIVQFVLLVLLAMSVACWVIIIHKYRLLRMATLQTQGFQDLFWRSRSLDQVYEKCSQFIQSPVSQVFKAGYIELAKLTKRETEDKGSLIQMGGAENLARALRRAATVERTNLQSRTTFLATTGSTAPFIGLFGTVWGILRAFQKIGYTGQATIQTVGPDIAHALIATAVGLAAAIPAVMAYNFFNSRIRILDDEMENFSSDFLNIVKRHFLAR
ncbi:MAG: protein TolQ [Myxococcota bacterium]|nr:protein TolQ [Myxococcota bacterium]